jgi:propionyl-CoA:succinyl-CoA transferase
MPYPRLTAEDAALLVPQEGLIALSGFARTGVAKAVTRALAPIAAAARDKGNPYRLKILSGASTGPDCDDLLAEAGAIAWRAPYQSSGPLRKQLNSGRAAFTDVHLSRMPLALRSGAYGPLKLSIVEATEITDDGRVYLTTSVGATPDFLAQAERVIIEVNCYHPRHVSALCDILPLDADSSRRPLALRNVLERMGVDYARVDPKKVLGVVETSLPDDVLAFDAPDAASHEMAEHVIRFLLNERTAGRIPQNFLPLQSGVGNIANAVLCGLGDNPEVPPFEMYTEVLQDAVVGLIEHGHVSAVSTTSLTVSPPVLQRIYANFDFFAKKIILRPMDISNHPGLVRQLGIIAMNTADIYGNVNSTHVRGREIMNGIGGSSDFSQNAHLSIFICPSIAKKGAISTIVPMCPHIDHTEHSVDVLVTEQGLADLRGLGPVDRAQTIISNCVHPSYRDYLFKYLNDAPAGHIRHDLSRAFELHENFSRTGRMLPE